MSKTVNSKTAVTASQASDESGCLSDSEPRRAAGGISRAFRLLDLITSEGPLRFSELEERSELPKATLHRLLNELSDERLLILDERALTYSAGYRILEIANRIWTRSDIRALARDQLLALSAISQETVQIAVHADTHVVVIDHVESNQSVRTSISVGHRAPVYCTGIGKVMLAWCDAKQQASIIRRLSFVRSTPNTITDPPALRRELGKTSNRGYAIDAEEHFLGSCCIAAPIVDHAGQAIAGISITAPTFRVDIRQLERWREPLMAAAAEVSRRLAPRTGASPDSSH